MFLTILLCCLSLAHAIVMTDGYYKSCDQYRKRLIHLLNSGREAEVELMIYIIQENPILFFIFISYSFAQRSHSSLFFLQVIRNRLSCGAIFDFMDYLQTDIANNNKWIMNKEIDTGFAFRLAIISTWFNFFAWTFAFLLNIIMACKRFRCC